MYVLFFLCCHLFASSTGSTFSVRFDNFTQIEVLPKIPDKYKSSTFLGEGTFGAVWASCKKKSKYRCAIKRICPNPKKSFSVDEEKIIRELRMVYAANNPFIVGYKDAFAVESYKDCSGETAYFLVMDVIPGMEFFDYLKSKGRLNKNLAKFFVAQMLLMLEYLHDRDVIFRDLKPENVMIITQGPEKWYLKLVDFGGAIRSENGSAVGSIAGTNEYLAPEVIKQRSGKPIKYEYTTKVDMYALGRMLGEMLTKMQMWDPDKENNLLKWHLRTNEYMKSRMGSGKRRDFLEKLLEAEPDKRSSAKEAMQHSWLKGCSWESLKKKKYRLRRS